MKGLKTFRTGLFFLVATAAALFLSCSSQVPLTPALISEYKLNATDVKNLQLYLSEGLLLEQEATTIDKDVDETHRLKTVEDSYVKQIYFKKKTPCIAQNVAADRLQVACEPSDQLTFILGPMPDGKGVYTYQPEKRVSEGTQIKRLPNSGYKSWKLKGRETYRDSTYNVLVKSHLPYLQVDQAGLKKIKIDSRGVKGMRPGEGDPRLKEVE